jgi:hypothetical protein
VVAAERELEVVGRILAEAAVRDATELQASRAAELDRAEAAWRAELADFVGSLPPTPPAC